MRKLFTLIVCMVCLQMLAEEKPQWLKTIEASSIVDSVVFKGYVDSLKTSAYCLYYRQPLCHANPQGESFELRCMLLVRKHEEDKCANEMYIEGYSIYDYFKDPFGNYTSDASSEIAQRYNGNLFYPEHRYFSKSSPRDCWMKLKYCNADEASQDFHALIQLLRSVFQGRFALTGISKGGIATAIQYAYFPNDADIYIPNCAPFCKDIQDKRLHRYFTDKAWSQVMRDRVNTWVRTLIEDTHAADTFAVWSKDAYPQQSDYENRRSYYEDVLTISFTMHSDSTEAQMKKYLDDYYYYKDKILAYYGENVNLSNMHALIAYKHDTLSIPVQWKHLITKEMKRAASRSATAKSATDIPDYKMTQTQWDRDTLMAYNYQAAREFGYYEYDIPYLYEKMPEKTHFADSLQAYFTQGGPSLFHGSSEVLKTVVYDNHALFDMVEQKTRDAQKPIIFIYGGDDPWTGAAMEDQFINGTMVHKYILTGQKHAVVIGNDEKYRDVIWKMIDDVMLKPVTGIDEVSGNRSQMSGADGKYVRGGRIFIRKNGIEYDMLGRRMK